MPKVIIVPESLETTVEELLPDGGSIVRRAIKADDGGVIQPIGGVLLGEPVEEDAAKVTGRRKAYASSLLSDAALAALTDRAAAVQVLDKLPADWQPRKADVGGRQ